MFYSALLRRRGTLLATLLLLLSQPLVASNASSCDVTPADVAGFEQAASLLQDRGERSRQPTPVMERDDSSHSMPSTAERLSAITIIHDPEPQEGVDDPGADDVVIAKAGDMVIAKGGEDLGAAEAPGKKGEKPTYVVIVPRFDHDRTPRAAVMPLQTYGDDSGTGWWLSGYTARDALTFFEYFLMFLFVAYGIHHLTHKRSLPRPLTLDGEDSFSLQSDLAFSRGLVPPTPSPSTSTALASSAFAPPAARQSAPPSEPADEYPVAGFRMPTKAAPPLEPMAAANGSSQWQQPMAAAPMAAAALRAPAPPLQQVPARTHLTETVFVSAPPLAYVRQTTPPAQAHGVVRQTTPPPALAVRQQPLPTEQTIVLQTTPPPTPVGSVAVVRTTRSLSPSRHVTVHHLPTMYAQPVVMPTVYSRSFETLPPMAPRQMSLSPRAQLSPRAPSQPIMEPSSRPRSHTGSSVATEPIMEPSSHS